MSQENQKGMEQYFFRASAGNFEKIPGMPIAYWLSSNFLSLYENPILSQKFDVKEGVGTRNDDVFMKMCWEVSGLAPTKPDTKSPLN